MRRDLENQPLCELRHVTHAFALPNGALRIVLEDVSIAVRANEVVALLGPSGSGKSTLLRILAGLLRPTRGEVFYHGRPLEDLNPGVAMVFQSFALLPWMTVVRNIEVVLEGAGFTRPVIEERVRHVIHLVGLAGFEDAYPRELSGGMKQRLGIARALAVNPEMLFLDEPFSQVDALTAESLRAEVLDIWASKERNPQSILIVSHDIDEVVTMADRIIVLGSNPGCVRTVVENRLVRPRAPRSADVLRLVERLHDVITGHELPDLPTVAEGRGAPRFEPLPEASPNEIVGLLEYLDSHGRREDLFQIAADTNREFGRVINVVKAGEMLDFLDTPKRLVVLTDRGMEFVKATADDRTRIFRTQLTELRLFEELRRRIGDEGHVDKDAVTQFLSREMPHENYEQMFSTLVAWARFGDLFGYDETSETLAA